MRGVSLLVGIACVALTVTGAVQAADDAPGTSPMSVAPPGRPQVLTDAQFEALVRLESQPQHADARDVPASYTTEHEARMDATRWANNIATAGYHAGFAGAILTILICAAPL